MEVDAFQLFQGFQMLEPGTVTLGRGKSQDTQLDQARQGVSERQSLTGVNVRLSSADRSTPRCAASHRLERHRFARSSLRSVLTARKPLASHASVTRSLRPPLPFRGLLPL